jgi:hypothetical protein
MAGWKLRALERALVFEKHIAGDKYLPLLVVNFDGRRACHMPGAVKDDVDLILPALECFWRLECQADEAAFTALDVLVREERIPGNILLIFLLLHHVRRVMEHLFDQDPAGARQENGRFRMLTHHHRQAANMIEMTMRDDDQIEANVFDQFQLRHRSDARCLRIQSAINEDVQIANLEEEGIGTDASLAV